MSRESVEPFWRRTQTLNHEFFQDALGRRVLSDAQWKVKITDAEECCRELHNQRHTLALSEGHSAAEEELRARRALLGRSRCTRDRGYPGGGGFSFPVNGSPFCGTPRSTSSQAQRTYGDDFAPESGCIWGPADSRGFRGGDCVLERLPQPHSRHGPMARRICAAARLKVGPTCSRRGARGRREATGGHDASLRQPARSPRPQLA